MVEVSVLAFLGGVISWLFLNRFELLGVIKNRDIQLNKLSERCGALESLALDVQIQKEAKDKVIESLEEKNLQLVDKSAKVLSNATSREVKTGQVTENLLPFLEACPYKPKDMRFLANPVDYLVFDFDKQEIVFLEIKTGAAKASPRQRMIKKMVREGKVFYNEIRINDKGVTVGKLISKEVKNESVIESN